MVVNYFEKFEYIHTFQKLKIHVHEHVFCDYLLFLVTSFFCFLLPTFVLIILCLRFEIKNKTEDNIRPTGQEKSNQTKDNFFQLRHTECTIDGFIIINV